MREQKLQKTLGEGERIALEALEPRPTEPDSEPESDSELEVLPFDSKNVLENSKLSDNSDNSATEESSNT
jgi:hypothetical protein